MAFYDRLVVLLLIDQHISHVMAAECTTAIVASVFGTIGGLLVIAAIVALVWYCCRRRESTALSSTSSADSASDPGFSFGTTTKSGNIGLNGSGTPVTFSHRYSEKAPSAAYNTSGVVNPAFADGREVLIDAPRGHHDEVKIDLDGDPASFKSPAHNGEVKIDMDGGSGIEPSLGIGGAKFPSGPDDVKLDMDWDHEHNVNFPDVNRPELELPDASDRPTGSRLPGTDANVVVKGPSTFKSGQSIPSVDLPKETVDVFLERPGNGGFGLLIARDKTLPPPALFIREVTPGGIAAKTGLVDKGDKIIAINDTSIEGLPHDQAMSLLRDDNQKIMHLTLLKKELYKLKGRSFDTPDGSIEESCNIDISPELEAGVPSLDVEGVQRRSPDGVKMDISGRKSEFNMDKPHLDMPGGRIKTHVSGPDAFTDVDLGKPSSGLDLPSPKKKSTRCFSCASRGDRDEPYMTGKSNVDMDLSAPDMKAEAKTPDFHFSSGKPDIKRLSRDYEGPNAPMEMKPGSNFDIRASGLSIRGPDVGDAHTNYELHGSSQNAELDVDKGRYGGDISLHSSSAPANFTGKPDVELTSRDFDGPAGQMEMRTGSNFDIHGLGPSIREPDLGDTQKKYGLHASSPDVELGVDKERYSGDVSLPSVGVPAKVIDKPELELTSRDLRGPAGQMEIKAGSDFDASGSGPGIKGPDLGNTQKKYGLRASVPDVDVDVDKGRPSGSISLPSSGIDAEAPRPGSSSADVNLPSGKKKLGTCLTCTGRGKKDEPYMKARKNYGYEFDGKDVDGSIEMDELSGPSIEASGPDTNISKKRPKAGLDTNVHNSNVPEGRMSTEMSGPDAKLTTGTLKGHGAGVDVPSSELNPASKRKGGSCFSCAGIGEKDEPYRTNKGKTEFDMTVPEVDGSMRMKKPGELDINGSGPDFSATGNNGDLGFQATSPDFNVQGPNKGTAPEIPKMSVGTEYPNIKSPEVFAQSGRISGVSGSEIDISRPTTDVSIADVNITGRNGSFSGPEFEASGPKRGVSEPDFRGSGPNTEFSGPTFNVRRPRVDASAEQPNVEIAGTPKVSGSNIDVSTGSIKDSKVNLDRSTAELDLPSRKTAKGGNCFSCAGGTDKDEPYQMKTGNINVDLKEDGRKQDLKLRSVAPDLESTKGGRDDNISPPNTSLPSASGGEKIHGDGRGLQVGAGFDANAPDLERSKGDLQADISVPDVKVSTGDVQGSQANLHGLSSNGGLPSKKKGRGTCLSCAGNVDKDEPYGRPSGNGEFKLDKPGVDGTWAVKKAGNFDLHESNSDGKARKIEINDIDFDLQSNRPKSGFQRPETDVETGDQSDIDIAGPDFSLKKPNVSGDFAGVGDKGFGFAGADLDGDRQGIDVTASDQHKIDIAGPDFSLKKPKASGLFAGVGGNDFGFAGPDLDGDRPGINVKASDQREIDTAGPDFSLEKTKVSSLFAGVGDEDFGLIGPDLDAEKLQGSSDWRFSGPNDLDTPRIDLNGPSVSGGDLDTEANLPGLGLSGSEPSFELGKKAFETDTSEVPAGNLRFDISKSDFDSKVDQPDTDISARKTLFGSKEFDMDKHKPKIPTSDFNFDGNFPEFGLDTNMATEEKLDIDDNRPGINGFGIDVPPSDIAVSDPNFDGSLPEVDASVWRPSMGIGDGEVDLDATKQDISVPTTQFGGKGYVIHTPEPNRELSFQPRGKDYDASFDWEVNTSTPKRKDDTRATLEPLVVANKDNLEMQSSPTQFPSMTCEEPRNLQRYDEIHPDMELRLFSPTKMDHSDPSFDFETPDESLDMRKDGLERRPGRMSLVKVEENVTIFSASLDEDELPSPRNRTLTLDREMKQKIEVVFPGEEGSDVKQISSTSSSSSSSPDSDDNKEKKKKRKTKSRLIKTSSRRSSTSEDDKEGKNKPSKGDALSVELTGYIKPKKRKGSASSSSSDNKTGEEGPMKQKQPKQRKTSTSSTSSSDDDDHKTSKLPKRSEEANEPMKYNVEYTTIPKQYILSADMEGPKTPKQVAGIPTVVTHIGEDIPEYEERKNSTSSLPDESITKQKMSPKDLQPSVLYQLEHFTNQQNYIVEPHVELDKPELSAAEVQEDAPKVEFHSVKPEDPKFSFIQSKERKGSASSSSSDEPGADNQKVAIQVETPSVEPKDPALFFTKSKERKSSTSSSSSEGSGRLSPNLDNSHSEDGDNAKQWIPANEDDRLSPTRDMQAKSFETVYEVKIPETPAADEDGLEVQERSPVVVLRSIKRISPGNDDLEGDDQLFANNADIQLSEPSNDFQLDYPEGGDVFTTVKYVLPKTEEEWIVKQSVQKEKPDIAALAGSIDSYEKKEDAPKVEFHSVKPEDPKFSFIQSMKRKGSASSSSSDEPGADDQEVAFQVETPSVEPKDPALFFTKSKERKSSTTSSSSEDSGRLSPNLDVSVHRYETVHHVPTPDHPLKDQPDVTKVNEEPLVVVTRSFKRPVLQSDEKSEQEHSSIQFTQTPVNLDYHLQYPHIIRTGIEDNAQHIQEEGITPVVSSTPVEYEGSDLSVLLQPESSHSEDEDKAKQRIPANEDDRVSPTRDMQAHSFETVYEVKIPEKPATDEDGLEIQERSPVVVLRSLKWNSPGNDDLEGDDQLFANNADIQLNEPSNDFQLDYPEGGDVFTTVKYVLPKTEEEWIVKHSVQKEKPDIAALAGSIDSAEKNDQQKVEDTSPRKESLPRRNSNSRIWELMQGYLIERPIVDTDEVKPDPEKTTEVKSEEESKSDKVERTVYNITYQPAPIKFDTVNVQVQASNNKETVKEMPTSAAKVESVVPKVTSRASQNNIFAVQPDVTEQYTAPVTAPVRKVESVVPKATSRVSQFNIFTVQPDRKEQHTASVTAPVPKLESVVPKVASSVSQFEPVAIQLDIGGKKPVAKEPHSSWKKQASHLSDTDDTESDPWMRHYSKGLYQRGHHQPSTAIFTEKESTVAQSHGISLSKVPHVKGVRKSTEQQRERPRYSIEGRARIEPVSFPGPTDRIQTRTSRQEPPNRPSVSSLRSIWDK